MAYKAEGLSSGVSNPRTTFFLRHRWSGNFDARVKSNEVVEASDGAVRTDRINRHVN